MTKFGAKWNFIIGIAIVCICLLVADSQFFDLFTLDEWGILSLSTFIMVVIVEAAVLYRFGWTLSKSAIDSLFLNLVSTVVSILVFLIISAVSVGFYPSLLTGTFDFYSVCAFFAVIIALEFLLSVAIEFYTLKLTRREENRVKFRKTVIATNLLSLPVMILFWIIAIIYAISTQPWNF